MTRRSLQHRLGPIARRTGVVLSAALALQGCASAGRRPPSRADSLVAASRLDNVTQDVWRFLHESRPALYARSAAVIDRLPDPTQDRLKKDAQFARVAMLALDQIFVDALSEDAYVTWLSLRWDMEMMSGWPAFHATRLSDLAPGHSVFDRAIEVLQAQTIRDRESARHYAGLVVRVGSLANAVRAEYAERAERGVMLPAPVANRTVAFLRDLVADPASSPFRVPERISASADTSWRTELLEEVDRAIRLSVNPGLEALATLLEREQETVTSSLSLSRLPGGEQHYAALLRYHTTLDIDPVNAHAIGLGEVARIAALAAEVRDRARLPVDRDSLRAVLRSDTAFQLQGRGLIAEQVATLLQSALRALDTLFVRQPAMPLSIGPLPLEWERWSPLTVYEGPSVLRPAARYQLNISRFESRSTLELPGLVFGDLMPGLHLLVGTQFENAMRPPYRRFIEHDGFIRGWQTYVLDAAQAVPGLLNDHQQFGVRLRELAAACGLVVDTGINALGWSHSEALAFLRSYLPHDDLDLERDFIWPAAETPGTLAAATLGAREFRGLRRWAERELGDRFSLAAFHREVLRTGSVPLPVLGAHLERWFWELNNPPAPPGTGTSR